ncbi:molybdenum cofactor guanylyltransferase [Pseudonocardia sp. CA-107938]|uniref:molybdenum cofactor guanylyltransferase n=1 Tax=Pseudonocardia sp. CA-107938 TaxID=3240021 RepID=UPI003D8F66F9
MATEPRVPDAAGIVLAGGRSTRMGTAKAALEWHGSTLLARVTGLLLRAVAGPVVVARAPGQPLPQLPGAVEVVDDPDEGLGPMHGIASGLGAVAARTARAFVCSTDLPLLHPAFVRAVLARLGPGVDVVMPQALGHPQPLAAAYRTAIVGHLHGLLAAGRVRPARDLTELRVERPDAAVLLGDPALAAADPHLDSLLNVNRIEEYRAARARPAPLVTVLTSSGPVEVRAATRGAASAAVGWAVDDPDAPLVPGDVVDLHG